METCEICGKEYKNLMAHVKMGHKMTMEDYRRKHPRVEAEETRLDADNIPEDEEFNEIEDVPLYIQKGAIEEPDKSERKLSEQARVYELLDKHEITLSELEDMIEEYKGTTTVTDSSSEARLQRVRKNRAINLIEKYLEKDKVEVRDLYIAEILTEEHGYRCKEVKSGPPKTWVLIK